MNNNDWLKTVDLLAKMFQDKHQLEVLELLMTDDERSSLIIRAKIVQALVEGSMNQRQLKEKLGVGIATITRGSNSLKKSSPEIKKWLGETLTALDIKP